MALLFGRIFCPTNGYFMGTFWYLWKALCMHFQKLVFASPYYSIWRSYEQITGGTSKFSVLFFESSQNIEPKHCQNDCLSVFSYQLVYTNYLLCSYKQKMRTFYLYYCQGAVNPTTVNFSYWMLIA